MSTDNLTWLHISDLHIGGQSYDQDVVLRALIKSLPDLTKRNGSPDIVFVTGDIAIHGMDEEYVHVSKFFDILLDVLGLEKSRLFVVPGNHDINRKSGKYLVRTLVNQEESDDYFDGSAPIPHIEQRQQAFTAWHNSYFSDHRPALRNTTCQVSNFSVKNYNLSYSRRSVSGPLWAFAAAGCIARTTGIAGVCFTAFGLMGFSG